MLHLAAIVRTDSSLACNSIVIGKALAFTSFSVTDTLVGALNQGVGIVRGYDRSNPGETPEDRKKKIKRIDLEFRLH